MKVQDAITDSTIASFGSKATYTGAASAVYGGLTANDIAAFGGLLIAGIGALIQLFFKLRQDRRASLRAAEADRLDQEFHRERMSLLYRQERDVE